MHCSPKPRYASLSNGMYRLWLQPVLGPTSAPSTWIKSSDNGPYQQSSSQAPAQLHTLFCLSPQRVVSCKAGWPKLDQQHQMEHAQQGKGGSTKRACKEVERSRDCGSFHISSVCSCCHSSSLLCHGFLLHLRSSLRNLTTGGWNMTGCVMVDRTNPSQLQEGMPLLYLPRHWQFSSWWCWDIPTYKEHIHAAMHNLRISLSHLTL